VRIALIGAGAIARHHVEALRCHDDVRIAAVCDIDPARAALLAGDLGARSTTEWRELLDGEADALFVCTPPGAHGEPAIAGFERGLPVYLEKPLARSLADGEAIVAAWRRTASVCAVGYQWRSLPLLDRIREALDGDPPGMLVSRSFGATEPGRHDLGSARGSWFTDRRASGGILFELGSHDIDLQIALAGPVRRVQGIATSGLLALRGRADRSLDDAVAVLLEFSSGAVGLVAVAWTAAQHSAVYSLDVQAATAALDLELDPAFTLIGVAGGVPVR
jgi:predicted dehydrogenase